MLFNAFFQTSSIKKLKTQVLVYDHDGIPTVNLYGLAPSD